MSQSSRTAVKKFIIDNCTTAIPNGVTLFSQIVTTRAEPKLQKLGNTIFVEVGETRRRTLRIAAPRGGGQKWALWEVDLLVVATASDEQAGADQFEAVFDAVCHSYETVSLTPPPTITDPTTGTTSVMFEVGEAFNDVVFRPELTAEQGRAIFRGVVTLPVKEYLSGI